MTGSGRAGQPTVSDVARAAGVSRATAARALGGYGRVGDATRDQVLRVAASLNYRPNVLARSMRTGSTHTLGVVVADIEDRFFARAVRGITDVAHGAGFEVILANSDERVAEERAAIAVLSHKQVDGLIVAPASTGEVAHLVEAARRCPVVLFDRSVPELGMDSVVVDNRESARNAVEHLIGLGHHRIAIIAPRGPADVAIAAAASRGTQLTTPTNDRLLGYLAALELAGIEVRAELVRRCAFDRVAAAAETSAVLGLPEPPTAIFATDGTVALGVVDAVLASGRVVPDEISIVGFDDPEWTTILRPPLTVVAQPVYELGRAAAETLLGRLHDVAAPARTLTLPTTLVLRGSTAGPPRRGIASNVQSASQVQAAG